MAKCLGTCYWIQYETKWPESRSIYIRFESQQHIPGHLMPTSDDIIDVVKNVMREYNRRKQRIKITDCEEDCECEMLKDQDPPWTDWKRLPFQRVLQKETENGKVSFMVRGEVEMRKRFLKGVCVEKEL